MKGRDGTGNKEDETPFDQPLQEGEATPENADFPEPVSDGEAGGWVFGVSLFCFVFGTSFLTRHIWLSCARLMKTSPTLQDRIN